LHLPGMGVPRFMSILRISKGLVAVDNIGGLWEKKPNFHDNVWFRLSSL